MDKISDESLCIMSRNGDIEAEEQLIKKYVKLVRACCRPYFLAGGDSEDLFQEGMCGLLSAIRRYDPKRDASFKTYSELCVRNRLYSVIKSAARFKHTPLNDYVSLESPQFDESQTCASYFWRDPEETFILKEHLSEIMLGLCGSLSKLEKEVLGLYLEGLSYSEIAEKTGRSPKSVDNAVQRIRKKLAQSY